ncbi:hypothetical protein C8F04DRAFT_1199316 [Mycena alexandri]|uniref:Uncharacterized protein n=1 Tax=Mycena alexandri TaxID=1745969 RepID=A0AAD6RYY6_9AGAR|nr:hypothetical protein C8F04DRAFT_1199316 [Mycena alexandri]
MSGSRRLEARGGEKGTMESRGGEVIWRQGSMETTLAAGCLGASSERVRPKARPCAMPEQRQAMGGTPCFATTRHERRAIKAVVQRGEGRKGAARGGGRRETRGRSSRADLLSVQSGSNSRLAGSSYEEALRKDTDLSERGREDGAGAGAKEEAEDENGVVSPSRWKRTIAIEGEPEEVKSGLS